MRVPIFKIVCDDDPMDPAFPIAITRSQLWQVDPMTAAMLPGHFPVGGSMPIGGGAGVQFTITRIR